MLTPLPPQESQMTRQQRIALKRILQLTVDHFHRGLISIVYKGDDQKMRVQVVSNCSEPEQLDLARRTLQQVEKSTSGIITTLTPQEKRIIT